MNLCNQPLLDNREREHKLQVRCTESRSKRSNHKCVSKLLDCWCIHKQPQQFPIAAVFDQMDPLGLPMNVISPYLVN